MSLRRRIFCAGLLASACTPAAATAPLRFAGRDYLVEAANPSRITQQQHRGRHAVAFRLQPGDCRSGKAFNECDANRERTEISPLNRIRRIDANPHYDFETQLYIPHDTTMPRGGMGMTVFQVKVIDNMPALDLFIRDGGHLRVKMDHAFKLGNWDMAQSRSRQPVLIRSDALLGRWYRFGVQGKWSGANDAHVAVSVNGTQVFSYRGPNVLSGKAIYAKFGIYRWDTHLDPSRGAVTLHQRPSWTHG